MVSIDVVLPVHNEGESIAQTLREFLAVTAENDCAVRFVVSEDGSTDDTVEILQGLAKEMPIKLLSATSRKGYSQAVIDGLDACDADLMCCVDSDGQCDPSDLAQLIAQLPGHDIVFGQRTPRADPTVRIAMSAAFRAVYRVLFGIRLRDPSCPYVLMRKDAWTRLRAQPNIGRLPQGFWWEFLARAHFEQLKIATVPVSHRVRTAGTTQVYRVSKVPRIAAVHLAGLVRLRRDLTA